MPDHRRHRGQHPDDATLFTANWHQALRHAVADYSWLLSRQYSNNAALKLVGDRYQLRTRQRLAVQRAACSDEACAKRKAQMLSVTECRGQTLAIDGFNCLIAIESALADGFLFRGRDGCIRDMASVHGSYRRVEETEAAIQKVGDFLYHHGVAEAIWYLDRPVGNSGRLAQMLQEQSQRFSWPWRVEVVQNPDHDLAAQQHPVVTTDSWILDRCRWLNLNAVLLPTFEPPVEVVNLA